MLIGFLKGKKTYIVGVLMILLAGEKYLTGDTTLSQFITTVQGVVAFNGAGLITLRAALKKIEDQRVS